MKRISTVLAAIGICLGLQAQNVSDALRFSVNDYFGTARSIAMGNAFTALGGDIGSITINPAGSAVNNYSQISFSPALNIMGGKTEYSADGYVGNGNPTRTSSYAKASGQIPSWGAVMNFDTHRKRGLKSFSFGVVGNATASYGNDLLAEGYNPNSSYMGYLSALSSIDGLSEATLDKGSYWDINPYYWPAVVGYRSGMISSSGNGDYVGVAQGIASDGSYPVLGELRQKYGKLTTGSKSDIVFNFGMNFNNRLYIGANLGITDLSYSSRMQISESAVNVTDFPVTEDGQTDYFKSMRMREYYRASGSGLYGKFGIIYNPVGGLRLGASVQTPTVNYITEHLWYSGETDFDNAYGYEDISEKDEYIYDYRLVSPMRADIGVAYTFGKAGLVSVDYELCNYSSMRFKEIGSSDNGGFDNSNRSIEDGAGVSHMLRIGAEMNVLPALALRFGYNLTSTPERYINDSGAKVSPGTFTQSIACGVGYRSPRSFFCDLALRSRIDPVEYIYPYPSYDAGTRFVLSPEIVNRASLASIVMTFGWRF